MNLLTEKETGLEKLHDWVNKRPDKSGAYSMDKEAVIQVVSGILHAIRKNEIMPFSATRMDLEIVLLSELSQTVKGKYRMTSPHQAKRNDTKELTKQKETHRRRERTDDHQGGGWGNGYI